jgi:hypothetical protein
MSEGGSSAGASIRRSYSPDAARQGGLIGRLVTFHVAGSVAESSILSGDAAPRRGDVLIAGRTATRIGPNRALRVAANNDSDGSPSASLLSGQVANKASNGKPFVYDELVARMRAVLRRSNGPRHPRLTVCELEIDLASRVVTVGGEPVQLSAKEYELLVALAEDPERVFKKEELLRNVWGFRSLGRKHHKYPI